MESDSQKLNEEALKALPDLLYTLLFFVGTATALCYFWPHLALWVFPVLSMLGFRVMLLGWRTASYLSILVGLTPFLVFLATIALLRVFPTDQSPDRVQLLLAIHATIYCPLAAYVAETVKRWKVPGEPLSTRLLGFLYKRMLLFTLLFLGLAVAAGVYWIPRLVETKLEPWRAKEALANADRLWADSDKISAIRGYKSFLTTSPKILSSEFGTELDRLFRRVIEFEVNYGSKPEAVDWVERALYLKCEPYFESEECRKLWLDVKNQKSLKD